MPNMKQKITAAVEESGLTQSDIIKSIICPSLGRTFVTFAAKMSNVSGKDSHPARLSMWASRNWIPIDARPDFIETCKRMNVRVQVGEHRFNVSRTLIDAAMTSKGLRK